MPFIACFSFLQKAKKLELEITSEPTQKIDLMTIVDNKQSKRVCNQGDPTKDKALTMKFDYKEDFVETQTYTKTHGFTFNGNLKGRNVLFKTPHSVILFMSQIAHQKGLTHLAGFGIKSMLSIFKLEYYHINQKLTYHKSSI